MVSCDAKKTLFPLVSARFVRLECLEKWIPVFQACARIEGFGFAFRLIIADEEKSIDGGYRAILKHCKIIP